MSDGVAEGQMIIQVLTWIMQSVNMFFTAMDSIMVFPNVSILTFFCILGNVSIALWFVYKMLGQADGVSYINIIGQRRGLDARKFDKKYGKPTRRTGAKLSGKMRVKHHKHEAHLDSSNNYSYGQFKAKRR
jgi:hypothetical protein